ncbi:MAG: hypothetical protein IPG51_04890 [Chloroflexi bacterium]|nr:hypothetical protein [Chloroflexota bacterium]
MSAYDLQELIKKWETEKLTSDQAIGQILLQMKEISERMGALEMSLQRLRRTNKD